MAGRINFDVVDTPILEQTEFGPDMQRWLSTTVDIINASFAMITEAFSNLIAVAVTNVGGGGAGPINVTVTGLTSSGFVTANLLSSTNPVTIVSVVPGTNQFAITFSGDPGVSAVIAYQAYSAQPQ